MQIIAALTRGHEQPFTLESVTLDEPQADEIIVRIAACGLCHTDLAFREANVDGQLQLLGHEGAGVVERVGTEVVDLVPGDRVLISYAHCGQCAQCWEGLTAYCGRMRELNYGGVRADGSPTVFTSIGKPLFGSFFGQSSLASHALTKRRQVIPIREILDLAHAAPLGCSFQTGVGAVRNVLRPSPGTSVAILGAGGVGLSALMAAAHIGAAPLIVVDLVATRRETAERLGATHTLDPVRTDVASALREISGNGVAYALDTTGNPTVIRQGLEGLGRKGTLVVVGLGPHDLNLNVQDLMLRGKTLRGCVEGDASPQQLLPKIINLMSTKQFDVTDLVTPYPYTKINEAVTAYQSGLIAKPVILWDPSLAGPERQANRSDLRGNRPPRV